MTNRAIQLWGGVAAIAAGALATTTTRVAADTYPRQAGIRIAGYTFDITLNRGARRPPINRAIPAPARQAAAATPPPRRPPVARGWP